jgi:hypothetical protein
MNDNAVNFRIVFFLPIKMFAFEEVGKDVILPWVVESAIGSSVVTS